MVQWLAPVIDTVRDGCPGFISCLRHTVSFSACDICLESWLSSTDTAIVQETVTETLIPSIKPPPPSRTHTHDLRI